MINVRNLGKVLDGGGQKNQILENVSLTIEPSETVAILGRSGSGKSTLLSLLALFDRPTTGEYHCDGTDTTTLNDAEASEFRSATFGFVFQRFFLLKHLNAWENVALSLYNGQPLPTRRKPKQQALAALERVGIAHLAERHPPALSGGEQQRVALARALVRNPKYLFADEPTGALDVETGHHIMKLITGLTNQGTTVVMVTHDQDYAAQLSRIITIENGTLLAPISANGSVEIR